MLLNLFKNLLDTIKQWFETTGAIFNQSHQPVKIRIKTSATYQQHDTQRKLHALKHRR